LCTQSRHTIPTSFRGKSASSLRPGSVPSAPLLLLLLTTKGIYLSILQVAFPIFELLDRCSQSRYHFLASFPEASASSASTRSSNSPTSRAFSAASARLIIVRDRWAEFSWSRVSARVSSSSARTSATVRRDAGRAACGSAFGVRRFRPPRLCRQPRVHEALLLPLQCRILAAFSILCLRCALSHS